MSRNKALVAVSAGLLRKMDREQVKAVLAMRWPMLPMATYYTGADSGV